VKVRRTHVIFKLKYHNNYSEYCVTPLFVLSAIATDQIMKPNINAGDYAAFQNRLSAHDLALSQQGTCTISAKCAAAAAAACLCTFKIK
jgi:hypothetical protein